MQATIGKETTTICKSLSTFIIYVLQKLKFHTEEQKFFDHCCFLPTISHKLCETFTVAPVMPSHAFFSSSWPLLWGCMMCVCEREERRQTLSSSGSKQIFKSFIWFSMLLWNVLMNLFQCIVVIFYFCLCSTSSFNGCAVFVCVWFFSLLLSYVEWRRWNWFFSLFYLSANQSPYLPWQK